MPNLKTLLDALAESNAVDAAEAATSWGQGRTLYGGITAALSAHAATRAIPDLPPLRSAQIAFVGPATGRLGFAPRLLRQGRSATFVAVDVTGEAGPALRVTLLHAAARDSAVTHDLTQPPAVPPPDAGTALFADDAPAFLRNFDVRQVAGPALVSGADAPAFDIWVRHRDAVGVDPTIALLALADCLPPPAMVTFTRRAPISTMTWSIDLMPPIAAGDWYLARSTSEQAADGYSLQAMELWSAGRRVAVGRQIVAMFV